MRATLNHAVARKIIADGLWPDMRPDKCNPPHLHPNGNVITFYCWDERTERQIVCAKLKPDGKYDGPRRNIETLSRLAEENGLDLGLVIIPPPPPLQSDGRTYRGRRQRIF